MTWINHTLDIKNHSQKMKPNHYLLKNSPSKDKDKEDIEEVTMMVTETDMITEIIEEEVETEEVEEEEITITTTEEEITITTTETMMMKKMIENITEEVEEEEIIIGTMIEETIIEEEKICHLMIL